MGGSAGYVIVSGKSMEPMLSTGDLAVVYRRAGYRVGDVIAYRIPESDVGGGMLVIHRVTGGNGTLGYVLQGDNRDTADMWRPRKDDIVGLLQWHVPHAGTALFLLRTPMVIAGIVGFLGFWFVATSPDRSRPSTADELTIEEEAPPDVAVTPAPAATGAVLPGRCAGVPPGTVAVGAVLVLSAVSAMRQLSPHRY